MLELTHVTAGYGLTTVLESIDLRVEKGAALAILGRNGVGKTTLLATIMGHTRMHSGRIIYLGHELVTLPVYARAALGIGYVPQQREIFPSLTVRENLVSMARRGYWTLARVLEVFPGLAGRLDNMGNQLSGGEQQMLSVARALMINPSLLLLDEPLEGLAPVVADQLLNAMSEVRKRDDLTILLVEQQVQLALHFAEQVIVLERGQVSYSGAPQDLIRDEETMSRIIGVSLAEPIALHAVGAHPE